MKKDINLFAISNIGDKNNKRDPHKGMGRKPKWNMKLSSLSFEKQKVEFEEAQNVVFEEDINGGNDN